MNNVLFPLALTDAFGVSHPSAVAMVSTVVQQASLSVDNDGNSTAGYATLTYQIRFWHSEAVRVAGAQAQILAANSPSVGYPNLAVMQLTGEAALLPPSEWAEACRAHFETVVVPTLPPLES